jgi:hypothetical protein
LLKIKDGKEGVNGSPATLGKEGVTHSPVILSENEWEADYQKHLQEGFIEEEIQEAVNQQ